MLIFCTDVTYISCSFEKCLFLKISLQCMPSVQTQTVIPVKKKITAILYHAFVSVSEFCLTQFCFNI